MVIAAPHVVIGVINSILASRRVFVYEDSHFTVSEL